MVAARSVNTSMKSPFCAIATSIDDQLDPGVRRQTLCNFFARPTACCEIVKTVDLDITRGSRSHPCNNRPGYASASCAMLACGRRAFPPRNGLCRLPTRPVDVAPRAQVVIRTRNRLLYHGEVISDDHRRPVRGHNSMSEGLPSMMTTGVCHEPVGNISRCHGVPGARIARSFRLQPDRHRVTVVGDHDLSGRVEVLRTGHSSRIAQHRRIGVDEVMPAGTPADSTLIDQLLSVPVLFLRVVGDFEFPGPLHLLSFDDRQIPFRSERAGKRSLSEGDRLSSPRHPGPCS